MESPSPIEIISIDVPDTVLRKNIQNATSVACVASRHGGLEEAREKFINALVAENGNAKHITTAKAAYPGLAKQIIATETGESQILDEVGFVDDDRMIRKVVRVQPRSGQLEEICPSRVATSSKHEANGKSRTETKDSVKSGEDVVRTCPANDPDEKGTTKERDRESPVSSSAVSTVDNSGRHECALSDFSVDKEDYRLTRYGMDEAAEDDNREDSPLEKERSNEIPKDEQVDRKNVDQDIFSSDSAHCFNTQVLVLLSAMIHNPFEKEGALIAEENEGKSGIAIHKGESDGSTDKLSLLVQSPVPSSISDESTVKIQEIIEDVPENAKESSNDSLLITSKRDAIEIDGKYVKSVVNARKSPRRTKNGQMSLYDSETRLEDAKRTEKKEKKSNDSCTQSDETFYKTVSKSSRSPRRSRSKVASEGRYDASLKGSLDSVLASDSRTASKGRSRMCENYLKSTRSRESVKKMQALCYDDPSKADSTSQLITTNELDMEVDEFCSVCCDVNEMSSRTEEGISSPSYDNFYALEDDSEDGCLICRSWTANEHATELCEICLNQDACMYEFPRRRSRRNRSKVVDTVTDPSLDEDSFEIENCGFQNGPLSTSERKLEIENASESFNVSDSFDKRSRDKYFFPKDELAILSGRRINRREPPSRKKLNEDPTNVSQDRRRYSSVDDLQLAKTSSRSNDKVFGTRNSKLIGSADNIRASRSSRRCKSLQRSADNVRYVDSSTDNLDSLVESLDREDDIDDQREKMKVRDNETVKMILTKHGIKIISEKETAL